MYAIVVFDTEMKTEYIPFNWIINKIEFQEVSRLVRQRIELKCYWPPWSNSSKVSRAQKQCSEPDTDWKTFSIRLLAVAGNEKEACKKVKIAEDTSNVEEKFSKQKRKLLEKKLSSSEDVVESSYSESKHCNRRKKRMTEKHLKPVLSVGQSGDNHSESGNSGLFTPVVHTESSQNEVQHQQITQCVDFQSETNAMPKNMPGLPFDIISPLSKTFGHTTSEKLLLKILARQEEIIETQKLHSAMLYNIQQQINVTHGIMEEQIELNLPPKTTEDVAAIEEKLKDVDVKKNLVQVLVNNGGANLTDFVRRNMKHLFSPELARKYNLTGQKKKQPFQPLHLFQVMFCAAKKNYGTKENLSIKLLEEALSSWFSNARDRGKGGRKERVPVNAAEITL